MNIVKKEYLVPSLVYCLTCFVVAQILYMIMLMLEPVKFHLSPQAWFASFFFAGISTALYCTGGLAGLWLLIHSSIKLTKTHIKSAVLVGSIVSSVFLLGFTLAEDHLLLGAGFVASASVAIAIIVKMYLPIKPHN